MASKVLRLKVRDAILEAVRATADADVAVDPRFPARGLTKRHIFVTRITGNVDYVVMARAQLPHDDTFTVQLACYVLLDEMGDQGAQEAEEACLELVDAVNRAVSDNPSLHDMDGVFDVTLGAFDGPDTEYTDNGCDTLATIDVNCHTRIINPA